MNIKAERIIGVTLFLIGLLLGVIINLFTSDSNVQNWYDKNRIWVFCFAGALILLGVILIILSFGSAGKPSTEKETPKKENQNQAKDKDEQSLSELLKNHQENLHKLKKQISIYAVGEEPLHLLNQIDTEQKTIKEIEEQLRA